MLRSMKVKDFMSKNLVTLNPDMEVLHALHLLIDHNFSGAPVLDEHGRLVGMLTERDCMRVATQAFYHGTPGGLVKEHMSRDPVAVSPEDSILNLSQMFIEGRFHRYPVVDKGRLVGIIARQDVMKAMGKYYPR